MEHMRSRYFSVADHFQVPLNRNNFNLHHRLKELMDMKFLVQRIEDEFVLSQDVMPRLVSQPVNGD